MSTLTCPKCGSEMRSYERNRVLVDQCNGCGGLFLDRGELESLVLAENAWHESHAAPASSRRQGAEQPPAESTSGTPHSASSPRGYGKGRESFVSELFD
ncbi:MAG TPA: zf-TFIIB domain-containing protein [Dermatophilaceae bacterium]|nr:zf-TFIIB domain-containing protein [Dermatophilaceae bacterium]